jgi:hypothetical protein
LRNKIERARSDSTKPEENRMIFDHYHPIITMGCKYKQMEAFYEWGKSVFELEISHMLNVIINGFEIFFRWPRIEETREMCNKNSGLFKNCIGIMDASEHQIEKCKRRSIESSTYSGKQGV